MIGVGYDFKNLPIIDLTADIRFNQGLKNVLENVAWKQDSQLDTYAYNHTLWLNLNLWFKKNKK